MALSKSFGVSIVVCVDRPACSRNFRDAIRALSQIIPKFCQSLGLWKLPRHPNDGNGVLARLVLVSICSLVQGIGGLLSLERGSGVNPLFVCYMIHLIGLWDTHHNLANMPAIFHVAIGIFESLPVKHLADSGGNDSLLHE